MTKAYVLTDNVASVPRAAVREWADRSPPVRTRRTDMPGTFYLASETTAEALAQDLHDALGRGARFLVLEVTDNRFGWLPGETWYLLKNKRLKPEDAASSA